MATDDRQVLVTGQAPTPATFKIPGNGQIRPKAIFAHYDGTGAAVAYQPALKITSDAGELVGIYPTTSSVAAGGSADASWSPFLRVDALQPNTGGLWQPYTPIWTCKAGAQPSLGNGSLTGVFYQLGKLVIAQATLIPGTTTTFGSANPYFITLPVTAVAPSITGGLSSNCFDLSANADFITWSFVSTTTQMAAWCSVPVSPTSLEFVWNTQPITWATGDTLRMSTVYEAL